MSGGRDGQRQVKDFSIAAPPLTRFLTPVRAVFKLHEGPASVGQEVNLVTRYLAKGSLDIRVQDAGAEAGVHVRANQVLSINNTAQSSERG